MHTLKFKTNINCNGCINAVTPHLNKVEGLESWKVDTENPDKILTAATTEDGPDAAAITAVVEKAGFKISTIDS